jgi:tetratricopeptide (TPR) repeat protein
MNKLARLPAIDRAARASARQLRRVRRPSSRYFAFLSYSHKDEALADWLHAQLEQYRVPSSLVGQLTEHGTVPKRLSPIFRDRHELAAAHDLGEEIQEALGNSQFLIVLCSPDAAQSRWTNAEIETFKRHKPDGCVLAAIASGEPFASDLPGRQAEECFPPALRQKYDRRGRPTGRRAEPLAADLRGAGEERRLGLLKLIAGMLGVGLDDLVQREAKRRQRRLGLLAAASLAGMALTSTLAVTAIHARNEAREQKQQAEGLINFMLGDLKDKLEPIGRLDALDGVGARVLAYYQKQNTKTLSDSSLRQRSSALSLMAGVATSRGDLDGATRLYREAMAGTSEAIRREPTDPQRYFDHAQNVFYVGSIALQRGNQDAAMAAFREYKTLSDRETALDPNNITWRMEVQNADANLGVMLFNERHYSEAAAQLEQALTTIDAIVRVDPNNMDYQKSLVESLAWAADSELAEGHLDQAIAARKRNVTLAGRLLVQTRDSEFSSKLIAAHRALGWLYASRGQTSQAIAEVQEAADQADRLFAVEPGNSSWIERAAQAHLDMSGYLLGSGKSAQAANETATGCRLAAMLVTRDARVAEWRTVRRDCLEAQTNLGLATGAKGQALFYATQAVAAAKAINGTDPIEDRYGLARAYRLVGDVQRSAGDMAAARAAWMTGLGAIPRNVAERPPEMSQHQMLLQRLGRSAEAARLASKLSGMGYREPEFRSA